MKKVFVSSVQKELTNERLTIDDLIRNNRVLRREFEPVLYELDPAAPKGGLAGALARLEMCQIYLLIIGSEYGSVVDGLSITHHEYRRAKAFDLPRLVFIRGDAVRDPRTEDFLKEVQADTSKYKRFQNVVELRNEVHASLMLHIGLASRGGRLSRVLLLLILLLVALNFIPKWRFARLHAAQLRSQAIEDKLTARYPEIEPMDNGTKMYVDDRNAILGQDVWREGRLVQRILFLDGRPQSRDEFGYKNDKLASKTRYYIDGSNRIFLVDDFAVDGLLVHKRGCPDGLQNPCVDYYDIMRSPLPAIGQLYFYR